MNNTISAIPGVRVGHAGDRIGGTGCTVILFDTPATGAVDITGMATSSRQIDSLDMLHPGTQMHALCLAGGSAFGLDAATGVVEYLEQRQVGLSLFGAFLPVVPTAVIFDLSFLDASARPGPSMARDACLSASEDPVEQGCVGAGTGATAGKLRGVEGATKSGLGSALVLGAGGVMMGALVVANPFGDILDEQGRIIAGAREGRSFLNSQATILKGEVREGFGSASNTTLCVLVTDARLDKTMAMQVARMGGQGLSKHIAPFNTPFDGDMVFCLSVGGKAAPLLHLGVLAERAARDALLSAARCAEGLGGLPAARDMVPSDARGDVG